MNLAICTRIYAFSTSSIWKSEPACKSSRSSGGAIQKLLMYIRGLLIILVVYNFCGTSALQSVELQRSRGHGDV